MSCKMLVVLSAVVVVATAMSVKSPSGGRSGQPIGRQPSSRSGEPQSVPNSYDMGQQKSSSLADKPESVPTSFGSDRQKMASPLAKQQMGDSWKPSMSLASASTRRQKMPSFSSAITMSTDYLETLGIEPHRIVADSSGKRHHGMLEMKPTGTDSKKVSRIDDSDKLKRMDVKDSASMPIKRTAPGTPTPSQRCCMPTQFEAILASHIGTVSGKKQPPRSGVSLTLLSYDYTNKKLHLMYPESRGEMYRIFVDFATMPATSYTVMRDGSCQCSPMWGNMVPWCTPDNAELASGLSLTGSGDNVNMFVSPDSPVSMTLTRKSDCIFLMTSRTAGNPGKKYASMTVTTYMNVTMGISNPEIMAIPHGCNCTSNV